MDSDDLSLIKISTVEDSLLPQLPVDDFTFSFSPLHLQIPKSHTISSSPPLSLSNTPNRTIRNTGIQVHGSVSTYINKENLNNNENKLGVPNLSVEPQKMKRSKKAGGYNLRKSLAWDRAFFTEEGVLNDSELSMISGTTGDRDGLSVIDEQGRDSLPVNSGSVNLETLEENMFKELPSGYPNKRNVTCKSLMKRDSISGGGLAPVSKSAQKVAPYGLDLKKVVCKREVCSSPMASVSQKRLSITGTKQISTSNSKIPKVPVSKKNPSMTTIHSAASGQSLKGSGIPQPAARKSLCSKLSSKTKHTSDAAKASLVSVPKSNKPSTDLGNDMTNSGLRRHSLMSHRAPHTTKESKYSDNGSSQGRLSGGDDMVMSINETSSTKASSHIQFDDAGFNKKNVQGLKPSGLRMPSPSLRFFSETKAPVSNTLSQVNGMPPNLLKSSISTLRNSEVADHNHEFKPTQLLNKAPNVDVVGNRGLCSQKTDKCSTSSSVADKVHSNKIQEKCNQQAVEVRVPVGDMNSQATKEEQFGYDNADRFENQSKDQVTVSLKVIEKDRKSICPDVEFEEPNYKATILFQENRTANRSMLDESWESNAEVQSQLFEEVEYNSPVTNNDAILESQTKSFSPFNNLMSAPDCIPSSSIIDDDKTSGESNSCGVDQNNCQRSMKEQLDEFFLLVNGKSLTKWDEDDTAGPVCRTGVMAGHDTVFIDGVTGICDTNCSVAGGSKYKPVDDEQDGLMFDSMSSTMKLSDSSEVQDITIENHDMQQRNSTNFKNYDTKDICAVSLDVVERSSHCTSTLPELLDEVPDDHLCNSDQGGESQFSCASVHYASIAFIQCTEITQDQCAEADKQQVLNNNSLVKEMILLSNEADSNYSIVSPDCSFRISQVNNSTVEVKDQIDFVSCFPNNGDSSTLQTTHLEFQSSGMRSKDQVANPDPQESLCPVNKQEISPKDVLMRATLEECIEPGEPGCHLSPREASMKVFQHVDSLTDESTCNAEGIDDEDAITKQRTDDQKLTRPPPDVVPFSDEWLAAIESAGVEILTLKTGAVKHSPPDKSVHEPGPWSPVKRTIGPFDCTKYTNNQPDNIN